MFEALVVIRTGGRNKRRAGALGGAEGHQVPLVRLAGAALGVRDVSLGLLAAGDGEAEGRARIYDLQIWRLVGHLRDPLGVRHAVKERLATRRGVIGDRAAGGGGGYDPVLVAADALGVRNTIEKSLCVTGLPAALVGVHRNFGVFPLVFGRHVTAAAAAIEIHFALVPTLAAVLGALHRIHHAPHAGIVAIQGAVRVVVE